MSTTSRNSTSVANGPLRKPFPGVIALPRAINNRVSGVSSTPMICRTAAEFTANE